MTNRNPADSEATATVALVAYVSKDNPKVSAKEWIQAVLDTDIGGGMCGEIQPGADDLYATCICAEDKEKGFFYLKARGRLPRGPSFP